MDKNMIKWSKDLEKEYSNDIASLLDMKDFIELIHKYILNNEIIFDKEGKIDSVSKNALYDINEYIQNCIMEEYVQATECETNKFLASFEAAHLCDDKILLSDKLHSQQSYKGDCYVSGAILNNKEFIVNDEDFYSTIFDLIKSHPAFCFWEEIKKIYAEYTNTTLKTKEDNIDPIVEKENHEGFVYIGKQMNEDNLYKIGFTKTLSKRLSTFKCGNCFIEFTMTKKAKDAFRLEKELHSIFRHKKCKREWFYLDESDLNFLVDLGFNTCLK